MPLQTQQMDQIPTLEQNNSKMFHFWELVSIFHQHFCKTFVKIAQKGMLYLWSKLLKVIFSQTLSSILYSKEHGRNTFIRSMLSPFSPKNKSHKKFRTECENSLRSLRELRSKSSANRQLNISWKSADPANSGRWESERESFKSKEYKRTADLTIEIRPPQGRTRW